MDRNIRDKIRDGHYDTKLPWGKDPEVRKAYREDNRRLSERFKQDALEYVNLTGHPKAQKAWDIAYDERHSSGRTEIVDMLETLAELLY